MTYIDQKQLYKTLDVWNAACRQVQMRPCFRRQKGVNYEIR